MFSPVKAFISPFLVAALALAAHAADLTWVGNGTAPGQWAVGGGGWANGAVWQNEDSAYFISSPNKVVEITGDIAAGNVRQNSSDYFFQGKLGAGPTSLTVGGAGISTIGGTIFDGTSPLSIAKFGLGELILTNNSNAYTGGTFLYDGTLGIGADHALGTGPVTINGGEIRAVNGPRIVKNNLALGNSFTAGPGIHFSGTAKLTRDIAIISTSATFSGPISGAHYLSLSSGLGGPVILSGSNSHRGTTLLSGTLTVRNNHALGIGSFEALGGALQVDDGFAIPNTVILRGGSYHRTLSGDLTNAVNATSELGGSDTGAFILAGSSGLTTLLTSFSADSSALNDALRISDIYSFQGTGSNIFALQLSIEATVSPAFLGWLSGDQWLNARQGNTGNNPLYISQFHGSFAQFQGFHGTNLNDYVGAWGMDTQGGDMVVWAVLNHNSDFAIIPEPAAFALAAFGFAILPGARRIASRG